MKTLIIISLTLFFAENQAIAQYKISGTIKDSLSGRPIVSAKIEILQNGKVKFSSGSGEYSFNELSSGIYNLAVSKEGFHRRSISIYLDTSNIITVINIFLSPFETVTDTIDVREKYFKKNAEVNTSHSNVLNEEIRKTPGTAEDIVKYFESAPGVSLGSDVENALIVRGGSPIENLTIVDGMEIQNPNHFGPPGTTIGLLSYINLKQVKDVDFFTGGFPIRYGDKLSSVMDINFREGNREKQRNDINISATGFGGFFEGPINSKSSYMVSVRRSYLELIKHQLNTGILPEYWDVNLKLNYDISKSNKISFTGLFAADDAKPFEQGDYSNDTLHSKILAAGFNFIRENNFSKLRLTAGYTWNYSNADVKFLFLNLNENEIFIKQYLNYVLNKKLSLDLFSGIKYYFSKYEMNRPYLINSSNLTSPEINLNISFDTYKFNAGFNFVYVLFDGKLTLSSGARFDSFGLIRDKFCFSPRLGMSYKITPSSVINANAGIYYQSPEMLWIIAGAQNNKLEYIKVNEIVLGFEQYISNDMKLSVEPYLKQYYNYPVSVYNPYYIYINSGIEIYSDFLDRALSVGNGYFYGVDFSFQKKNSQPGLYGSLNISLTKSAFYALIGDIQPAEFDPCKQITVIAGYKFKFGLSLSTRFKYAGGRPYTPINISESRNLNIGVYNISMYNKSRMPDYGRMDFRIDYQASIGKTFLSVYVDLINIFNRVNYYGYYWSTIYQQVRSDLQLPRVPILGLSFQF